jgi:hypothetical protein
MMVNRLVALDKQPGTRPVGIGEVYRRLWAKCLLKAIGSQATAACGNFNLCAGLQAGIEGAFHAVRDVFADPSRTPAPPPDPPDPDNLSTQASEEPPAAQAAATLAPPPPVPLAHMTLDEAFVDIASNLGLSPDAASAVLLVDATNGFNKLGRKAMLWTVRHRWANGARFSFNCYRHSAQLLLRRRGDDCEIILSREGVTQGDPLSMVLYGLALTPLAETIRAAVPTVVQPWYADDAAMAGPIDGIAEAQRLLLEHGPRRGYFPEPDKSILIAPIATPPSALEPLAEFNFRHTDGHRYLGGFVGSGESEAAWVDPQVHHWKEGVHRLAAAARRYPQTAYAGLSQSLQSEWQFLQRVTPDIAPAFAPLEAAIATVFLPALLDASIEEVARLRPLLSLPTRLGGLGIPDPTKTGESCYAASTASTNLLHDSLWRAPPSVQRSTGATPPPDDSQQRRASAAPPRAGWPRSSRGHGRWRGAESHGRRRLARGSPPGRASSTDPTSRPRSSETGSASDSECHPPPSLPDATAAATASRRSTPCPAAKGG